MPNCVASERVRLGLTQGELASIVGVSRATVNTWEQRDDLTVIRYSSMKKLLDLFGCSEDYLLGKTEDRLSDRRPSNVN